MQRLTRTGFGLLLGSVLALGIYETTAKSPSLLGTPLPGWWATDRAEHSTRWQSVTGFLPLDKVLHESEEAIRFYMVLAGRRS